VSGFFVSQKGNMNASIDTNLEYLRGVILQHQPKQPAPLEKPPKLSHGWLLPYLLAADEFLWQRWRHWFETASAKQVIALIPQIQWARNEAGFKMLDRSLSAISKYGDWGGWGSWSAFDYFLDSLLYGFGHQSQPQPPEEKDEYQGASARLYQVFNLETLLAYPYDYFGEILAENQHGRHLGFFPTPMEVCQLMALMTLGGSDARTKSVMDPCVGTGRMLLAASNHSYRLYGCDINPTVIKVTVVNGYLYAPWLVRPFPFLDAALADPAQSPDVSESTARQAPLQLHCTEHDAAMQWQFEPIKKRRQSAESSEPVEQGALLLGF
jgi:hypothetical protein